VSWFCIIRDATGREEEQRNKGTASNFRIVMRTRTRRRPSRSLPALHALELRGLVDLHHAVDLTVWVSVVLPGVDLLTVHEDGRDAEILGLRRWRANPASTVLAAVELRGRDPALFDALLDVRAEVFVKGISRAVFLVEPSFEALAGRPVTGISPWRSFAIKVEVTWAVAYKFWTFCRNSPALATKACAVGHLESSSTEEVSSLAIFSTSHARIEATADVNGDGGRLVEISDEITIPTIARGDEKHFCLLCTWSSAERGRGRYHDAHYA
jgi:hypothetical protein